MRFAKQLSVVAKPLAVGILGTALVTAPFAGVSLAATTGGTVTPTPAGYAREAKPAAPRVSVKTAPVETAPVETVPVETVLVETAPVETSTGPRATRPGRYKVGVRVGGEVVTAEFTVTGSGRRSAR